MENQCNSCQNDFETAHQLSIHACPGMWLDNEIEGVTEIALEGPTGPAVGQTNPPPTPGRGDVTEQLIAHLRARREKGIKTYGTTLKTFNGRDPVLDLMEEQLDGLQYTFQYFMERQEMLKKIDELETEVDRLRSELYG